MKSIIFIVGSIISLNAMTQTNPSIDEHNKKTAVNIQNSQRFENKRFTVLDLTTTQKLQMQTHWEKIQKSIKTINVKLVKQKEHIKQAMNSGEKTLINNAFTVESHIRVELAQQQLAYKINIVSELDQQQLSQLAGNQKLLKQVLNIKFSLKKNKKHRANKNKSKNKKDKVKD